MEKKLKMKRKNRKFEAARNYASLGWHVLPLHSIEGESCACGKPDCSSPGKHPRLPNGFKGATCKPEPIRKWWDRWPKANVGIRTGKESKLVVLDIDPRNGGKKTLTKLIEKHGSLSKTLTVHTGGGGLHYYFKHPGGNVKGRKDFFGPGIDIKADGGYVVAPPSLHVSGNKYRWEKGTDLDEVDLAVMPRWLRSIKRKNINNSNEPSAKIMEGKRNNWLTSLAGSLRQNGCEKDEIQKILRKANVISCEPLLPEDEVDCIAKSIATYPVDESKDGSQATRLIKLASNLKLFHNPDMKAYAIVPIKNHEECWLLDSSKFENWLLGNFYNKYKTAASLTAHQNALSVLTCMALYDEQEDSTYVRVAGNNSKIWIDLGDADWRAVEVTATGWKLLSKHPVRFVHSATMRPLPVPAHGGDINELRDFLNLANDRDWALLLAWLAAALKPDGPCPLLVITGEHGSSKSTLCNVLRELVDPHEPALRSLPTKERDLMISAEQSWLLAYDNLSKITPSMSDALCRLTTGGGFATRMLYKNREEEVFNCKRPIILNGINDLANRPDLLDRSINLVLPPIPNSLRRTEAQYWRSFKDIQPKLFGALLDIISAALANHESIHLDEMPRMADFAKWATAAEPALGLKPGSFLQAYKGKKQIQDYDAITSSPIGPAIKKFVDVKQEWSGTAQELLKELSQSSFSDFDTRETRAWPKNPRGMSAAFRRIAPNLRATGIDVEFAGKTGHSGTRLITIKKVGDISPAPPAPPAFRKRRKKKARIWRK